MTAFLARVADRFNRLPLWRGEVAVWGQRMQVATFDRWLYLWLHRLGLMGRAERVALESMVRSGHTLVDVGANLGLYTVLLSRRVGPSGRVIAFEPDPDLFQLLEQSCQLNGCVNVEAHNLGLGSRPARLPMRKMILNSGDNTLGQEGSKWFRHEVLIEVVSLDEFIPGLRADLIKIDVQGWEFEVVRGMQRTLADNPRAEIHFEYWPAGLRRAGDTPEALTTLLRSQGYRLRLAGDRGELDSAALASLTRRLTGLKHADLVAFDGSEN